VDLDALESAARCGLTPLAYDYYAGGADRSAGDLGAGHRWPDRGAGGLDGFHDELVRAMALCGARTVEELTSDLVAR
jgi:hypothetical protein